jgi:regulator of sigma E protease
MIQRRFDGEETDFAGMEMRSTVNEIAEKSPALGLLKPGDVVLAVDDGTDHLANPTGNQVKDALAAAGLKEEKVTITVQGPDDAAPRVIKDIVPSVHIDVDRWGLAIGLGFDENHMVVAQTKTNSSAAAAKIPAGASLTAIDGHGVENWFQVRRIIAQAKPGQTLTVTYIMPEADARPTVASLKLSAADVDTAQMTMIASDLLLRPMPGVLKTSNPLVAMKWGVVETRDLILQFYLTLQRMVTGDLSMRNAMGPVGMFQAGAQFAGEGMSWLLWFLANISANLAVVNFLPIPIVDGGLFMFLVLEKIQGKPLSLETQRVAQMVGLVLLALCVFLLTYQDIARWAGYAY